jgi:hypothetical protein
VTFAATNRSGKIERALDTMVLKKIVTKNDHPWLQFDQIRGTT